MLGLDLLIAVLLVAAIAAAIILHRRFNQAKQDWRVLEALSGEFRATTARTDDSIRALKLSTATLTKEIERGDALIDDLRFLIERAGTLADRLESDVRSARSREGAAPAVPRAAPVSRDKPAPREPGSARPQAEPAAATSAPRSQAERALLAALRTQP
ncbi:MAG: DUF6468 domain-containing protein [Rhodospirillales bacterium]|nr:DUF6468 domain-containing protein [Rhodospirillales bacterium]